MIVPGPATRIFRIHPANPLEEAEAGEVCGCD